MADSMRISPPLSSFSTGAAPDASISHSDSLKYWTSISPDVNGMLGGYPQISRIDLQGSSNFLTKLTRRRRAKQQQQPSSTSTTTTTSSTQTPLLTRAADCGAGIGRITHGLLLHHAYTVDIVEPIPHFTSQILTSPQFSTYLSPSSPSSPRIGNIHNLGLEAWTPSTSYDLFWNQWCLGHLTDAQLVAYLRRCTDWLEEGGWVVVKENMSTEAEGEDVFDEVDSSVTRAEGKWVKLFGEAGLKVVATELQKGFPKGLYPVRTWALQPSAGGG